MNRDFFINIPHLIRRWMQKVYIGFHRKLELRVNEETIDENSEECLQICRRLISLDDSILLIAPLSKKRYIKNNPLGISIIIHGNIVQIINHTYSYLVVLGQKDSEKIHRIYDSRIEERRMEFEKEIKSNIKHSLKNIIEEIKNGAR